MLLKEAKEILKSNDYINGHISPKKWESMKNTFKVELSEIVDQIKELMEN